MTTKQLVIGITLLLIIDLPLKGLVYITLALFIIIWVAGYPITKNKQIPLWIAKLAKWTKKEKNIAKLIIKHI
jgi:hypothetical protein